MDLGWFLITVLLVLFSCLIFIAFVNWLSGFKMELKYIKGEIKRTTGDEQKYWIYRKRRLWLSILPFVSQ